MLDTFRELAWDTLFAAGVNSLKAAYPFLNWPVIGWLFDFLAAQLSNFIYKGMDEFFDLQQIAFKKLEAKNAFDKTSMVLRLVYTQKGIASKEFANARENGKKHLAQFIDLNPLSRAAA